jgi:hypothetical protein
VSISNYVIIENVAEKPLVIRDIGPWTNYRTVTNDAENVVADLVRSKRLPEGRRLLYFDSRGELSELLIREGQFAGFKAVVQP